MASCLSGVALAALLTTVSGTALAQQAPASRVGVEADDTDIIVTAQKSEQRAVDVPITISANSGERMRELGVQDLDELSNFVPGLNVQEQSANNPGIVIRGITSDSGSAQQGPRVSLYYNGVDISRSRGSYQAIYDLERIEVIKGPQATLFGTASTIGAISLISARPRAGFSGELSASYGNFDAWRVAGFVNAGSDILAGRIAFEYKKRDGYVENLAPNQDDLYAQDQLGVRGSLRFQPSDALRADLILTYDQQRNSGTPFISRALPTEDGPGNPFGKAHLGGSPFSAQVLGQEKLGLNREVYDANLTVAYDFADDWTLTLVNGYREFDSLEIFDADGSAAWYLEFAEYAKGWQASQETRFAYTGAKFRGSFGFNVFVEDSFQNVPFSSEEGIFLQCAANIIPGLGCINAAGVVTAAQATSMATGGLLTTVPYSSVFENQGHNESYSMFFDGTYLPTDRIELTAGVRFLIESRDSGYFARVPRSVLSGGASLIPGQVDTGGQTFRAEGNFSAVLPRFNALFRATDDINLFATVSKGRRSPVVQLSARSTATGPAPSLNLVAEEKVWNYEAGLKGRVGPVSGTLGVYYQNYDGFQVSVIQPDGTTRTESAGEASNFGVEAEVSLRATPWLNLFANGAYIDAKIEEGNALAPAFSGARFRLQPEVQAAAGFTIDAPLGGVRVFATPTVTYRSQIFFEIPNSAAISQPGVTLFNARAGVAFADDRFELAVFGRNLSDEEYLLDAGNTGGAFGIPTFIPAEPRFYGIELTGRF
ncbi:TonB-dependent receptor [Sphingomonas suaedae]|uniref:TonB-dependent receptor n=1 Tax=Sphingomonas suaedae TaxID=2599297 RepID=A0A518RGY3_9SPHN|nr:TonB-dependent receptor [Sphingomonas suaedae]QDX26713.1 TonB-dependent receptor [Sphingomonas suaedae]